MNIAYELIESKIHGYLGLKIPDAYVKDHLPNEIKEKLNDFEGTNELVETFSSSIPSTGFNNTAILLDIFTLEGPTNQWRIGEAMAEFYLESEKNARFYWNELRDQRNINSNKTGADLVGFIEIDGETVFLFGEVKTSNDPDRPPQVLYGKSGMIKQLEDLATDEKKVKALIRYLGTKARLYESTDPFRIDFDKALNSYISNMNKYNLIGILVRDVDPDKKDVESRYAALKKTVNVLTGLQLIALYISIDQTEWEGLVNGTK
jgi:hypothetical protein